MSTFDPEPSAWSSAHRSPRGGEPWALNVTAAAVFTAGCLLLRLARRMNGGGRR